MSDWKNCTAIGKYWARAKEGFTLLEMAFACGLLTLVLGSMAMAMLATEGVFIESQVTSQLNLRAQLAVDRVVELSGQALTTDAQFTPLLPSSGVSSHCLCFRLFQGYDAVLDTALYDPDRVYIWGADSTSANPSSGLIIGRGASLAAIYSAGSGPDGVLGTVDDDTNAMTGSGNPFVETLVPSTFAPQAGDMFTVDVSPAPVGRLLTFTLRLNARRGDGTFLLPADLVIVERVALRG